jgi:hypothetical protein
MTETDTADAAERSNATDGSPYAVLCELEGAVMSIRQAEYEALRSLVGESKKELTPGLYARYCVNRAPESYLPDLIDVLGLRKSVSGGLVQEVQSGLAMFVASPEAVLSPLVAPLLAAAVEREMPVVFLTGLKEATVRAVLERWGGPYAGASIFVNDRTDHVAPAVDVWMRMAKFCSRPSRQCVALVGTHFSSKSALSAGMRCIAVPDAFTAAEDFGGCDAVLEAGSEWDPQELLGLVAPEESFI